MINIYQTETQNYFFSIKAPAGYRIKLTFADFTIPNSATGGCENVFLKILDTKTEFTDDRGNLHTMDKEGYNVCGSRSPSSGLKFFTFL